MISKKILRIIVKGLNILLMLSLITVLTFSIFIKSTVLNKEYITKMLENTNYFANIYSIVRSDFENYIYQSGLDIKVLDGIIDQGTIQRDTIRIIDNIYLNKNEELDLKEFEQNLRDNIGKYLKEQGYFMDIQTQSNINEFINTIEKSYIKSISSYSSVENQIKQHINKIKNIINFAIIVSIIVLIILLILWIIFLKKSIINLLSIALLSLSFMVLLIGNLIKSNIEYNNISIINDGISITMRGFIDKTLIDLNILSAIYIFIGIILCICYCKMNEKKEDKN